MSSSHVRTNPNNPESVAICDYSGFTVPRSELVKQYEWRGDRLAWTGYYVWKKFVDKPNSQLRPPKLPPDPVPVPYPRPDDQMTRIPWSKQVTPWKWETTPWDEWGSA